MSCAKRPEQGQREKNKVEAGVLYLVATPIGNLGDLSERAVKVLSEVDFIAAEDTRNSMRLLTHLGISRPMVSYFEHNKRERGEQIAERLAAGESCALITDAGTPAISDPGEDMVALCAARGIRVSSIPGPVASITALTLSGLPTSRFTFEGFLSQNKSERAEHLSSLAGERRTMLFHEAPHKLRATLKDLCATFGATRRIAICRELTKLNEEVLRITLGDAVAFCPTPYELFSEICLRIRDHGPCRHNLAMSLTNGYEAYLPSESAVCRGGYEVDCFCYGNVAALDNNTDTVLVKHFMRILRGMNRTN